MKSVIKLWLNRALGIVVLPFAPIMILLDMMIGPLVTGVSTKDTKPVVEAARAWCQCFWCEQKPPADEIDNEGKNVSRQTITIALLGIFLFVSSFSPDIYYWLSSGECCKLNPSPPDFLVLLAVAGGIFLGVAAVSHFARRL